MAVKSSPSSRIMSLDQFRGYTILGMYLVNFVGSYQIIKSGMPLLAHHNTYCSYADTIMPHFLFAVGFAFRLTFLRRREKHGASVAYRHAITRNFTLLLVAFAIHHLGTGWGSWEQLVDDGWTGVLSRWGKREYFQTLTHIAVTSFWVLPVIAARPWVRIVYAVSSGALHLVLSYWFNYRWVNSPPVGIDGGPLGFLTWTIPLLIGSLAYDLWQTENGRLAGCVRILGWGLMVMAFGYFLSCLHLAPSDLDRWQFRITFDPITVPLVHVEGSVPTNDLFSMSQRSGSVSYLLFGAGASLAIYGAFILACDIGSFQLNFLHTLGTNALAAYIIHDLVNSAVKPFVPRDSPMGYVFLGFAVSLSICYVLLRGMEKQQLYLKL